jgi:hypothetical protein
MFGLPPPRHISTLPNVSSLWPVPSRLGQGVGLSSTTSPGLGPSRCMPARGGLKPKGEKTRSFVSS